MTGARTKIKQGNVKDLGLPEVRGHDGGVVWDLSLKWGNSGEDWGMVNEVLEIGDG